jgi:hypothetical protein
MIKKNRKELPLDKAHLQKAYNVYPIIVKKKKLNSNQGRMYSVTTVNHHSTGSSSHCNHVRKGNKRHENTGKERSKQQTVSDNSLYNTSKNCETS